MFMPPTPFYDPEKSYEENFEEGPFGAFTNGEVFKDEGEPKYDFFGTKVYSPFGIPAGPLFSSRFVRAAFAKGFDLAVYKTVRTQKYPAHPLPNVIPVEIPAGLLLGKVPSYGPEVWLPDMKKIKVPPGHAMVGAFQGTKREHQTENEYIQDFADCAKLMLETNVKVMEVNFSCPNEGTDALLCYDADRCVKVINAVKKVIGDTPLIIKISHYKDEEAFRNFIKKTGPLVEGIAAINTVPAEILDKEGKQALPGKGRLISGVCGAAIKWAGLDMVKRLTKLRKEFGHTFTIIGVGGVMTADDFFEYREAGADFVMSATGAMWNPYLAREIKERLR
jgi:dihydroorotate dehydrogenase (NAD+) catalytic subunit